MPLLFPTLRGVVVAAALPMLSACAPEPGAIGPANGSPGLSATELLRRIKDVSEFHRLTSTAELEHAFHIRIGPAREVREGEAEASVSGWLAMPPDAVRGDRAYRYRIAGRRSGGAPPGDATLFEASLTLWLADAPCLDFAQVAHGFLWRGPWAVSLAKDTFHPDPAPGSIPPPKGVGSRYATEFRATQPGGSLVLFRFPVDQPCAEQVTLAQYGRG